MIPEHFSKGSVSEYIGRAVKAGIGWPAAASMSDADLEAKLFKQVGHNDPAHRAPIDFAWVHRKRPVSPVTDIVGPRG